MLTIKIAFLGVLAYQRGFTLWVYRQPGLTLADAMRPGFFDSALDLVAPGDRIMVSASDGAMDLHVAAATEAAGVLVERLQATVKA
jgi:hypothetical protein